MKVVQILYPVDAATGCIHSYFRDEAQGMLAKGFLIGLEPLPDAEVIIKRGFTIKTAENYPRDNRMIQGWDENIRALDFTRYGDIIKPWAIPFEEVSSLKDEDRIKEVLRVNNWTKVFIKSKNTSLFAFGDDASVYPTTSLEWMSSRYEQMNETGPFIIRQFIDNPEIFYDEQRYWIVNGNLYHPTGIIPQFVKEAGTRVYKFSGSKYFTIDVAGNYIVEINPGESSDRGGENPLDFFCEMFAKEFL